MSVGGLTLDPVTKTPIVILKDRDNKLNLPIWIGLLEATAMATELEGIKMARPMTHDLLRNVLDELGATVECVEITDLQGQHLLRAHPSAHQRRRARTIDSRPSDAISLALRTKSPIYVDKRVIENSSVLQQTRRRQRHATSPTSRATSGPRSWRRCRPTISSTRCNSPPGRSGAGHYNHIDNRSIWHASAFVVKTSNARMSSLLAGARSSNGPVGTSRPCTGPPAASPSPFSPLPGSSRSAPRAYGRPTKTWPKPSTGFQAARYAEAASQLAGVADRWQSTPIGHIASLYAAEAEAKANNVDAASTRLRDVVAAGQPPSYLQQQALVALGSVLERKGDVAAAAEQYAQAAAAEGPYTATALLGEARCREQAGEKDKARTLYERFAQEFSQAPEIEVVQAKITALKG